jgi:TonB-linked SusC/RagA family outer membrane protein
MLGMETQSVAVSGRTAINVVLQPDAQTIDDVIVVAYGNARRSTFTGAASNVRADELEHAAPETVDKMLAGRVAGVRVGAATGSPGAGGEVQIRGIGSINGSTAPLYVVDGMPIYSSNYEFDGSQSMLTSLNPADIETMTILKDAAAASLYGSRASNGVIIITTKKGLEGRARVNFSASVGVMDMAVKNTWSFMSGTEFYDYTEASARNYIADGNGLPGGNGTDVDGFMQNYMELTRTNGEDWKKFFFRTGIDQNYNVNVSGGSANSNYYVGLSYQDVKGIVDNSSMKRYSFMANTSTKVNNWLSLEGKAQLSYAMSTGARDNYQDNAFGGGGGVGSSSVGVLLANVYPTKFAYNPDGSVNEGAGMTFSSPVYETGEDYIFLKHNNARALVNANAEIRFTDKLKFRSVNGVDFVDFILHEYWGPRTLNGASVTGLGQNDVKRMISTTSSNTIQYSNTFADRHNIDVLGGYEVSTYDDDYTMANVNNFSSDKLFALATGQPSSVDGYYTKTLMTSFLANANYNFADKYYAAATIRSDKSSKLGVDNRTGIFWSVSGAWRISSEEFLADNNTLTNLRLRASYGTNGNLPKDAYGHLSAYSYAGIYGSNPASYPTRPANPNLSWEKSKNLNVGLDFSLFGRFDFVAEYFDKKTDDLLLEVPSSAGTGFKTTIQNSGSIRNSGMEFEFHGNNITNARADGFRWGTSLLLSTLKSKVVSLPNHEPIAPVDVVGMYRFEEGKDLNSMYLPKWYGVDPANGQGLFYLDPQKAADYGAYASNPDTGNLTNNYNNATKGHVGKGYPDVMGSWNNTLSWKGFSLDVLLTYQFGGDLYNYMNYFMQSGGRRTIQGWNQNKSVVDNYWTKAGDRVDNPRPTFAATNWDLASSRWVYSSDFVRLKQLSLSYSLPKATVSRIGMSDMTFTLSAYNLTYLWAATKDMDVETNVKGFLAPDIPLARTITLGVKIGF